MLRTCLLFLGIFTGVFLVPAEYISWVTAESDLRGRVGYEYGSSAYLTIVATLKSHAVGRAKLSGLYAILLCGLALSVRVDSLKETKAGDA
jgi:hypothetical protein